VIEVGAFVHPGACRRWQARPTPSRLAPRPGVRHSAIVPNEVGLDRAIAAGVREIAVFPAASETFSQRNLHLSIDEAMATARRVTRRALDHGMRVRGYLSTCFGCPCEGDVDPWSSRRSDSCSKWASSRWP
jgi:hydroxymethylglutaryl-CoA lyase